jgi:O-antigen/teichoic acid export membrane protein
LAARRVECVGVPLHKLLRSVDIRHGVILSIAMIVAGGLDYAVSVVAGRWLEPVDYGVFVPITALLQILVYLALAIRNVVAFYTAELRAERSFIDETGAFIRHSWRWAWQWGLIATAFLAVLSPRLAGVLRFPNPWPLWAACPAVVLLFVRSITDGTLQGTQSFGGFGVVQVTQSMLRLVIAAVLIRLGLRAPGAIAALPIAMSIVLVLALWRLRPYFEQRSGAAAKPVCWHYSSYTLMGLALFAVLANMDALFVKHFFSPRIAGDYGPVVTLARVTLFTPLAMGIILLPKAKQRHAAGRDTRPILLLALAGAVIPGLIITSLYLLLPGLLVKAIFTGAYANPGIILGLASLAASLYAGLNIWLNYALALERPAFIYALAAVLLWQGLGMFLFGRDSLIHMTCVMVSAGIIGNLAGVISMWHVAPTFEAVREETLFS